jgi:CheY-like chemotaxis protein
MGRTALVCDDDPVARGVVALMVQKHGWEPAEVATPRAAIELAGVLRPDVVVLDVALAGMSGLDAAPLIQAQSPDARIVMVSAFEVPAGARSRAGAIDVVGKHELPRLDEVLRGLFERVRVEEGLTRLYDALLALE